MSKKKSKAGKGKHKKAKSVTKKRKQIAAKYNVPLLSSNGNIHLDGSHAVNKKGNNDGQLQKENGSSSTSDNGRTLPLHQTQTPYNYTKNFVPTSCMDVDNGNKMSSCIASTSETKQKMNRRIKANIKKGIMQSIKKASKKEQKEFMKEYQSLEERTMQQQRNHRKATKQSDCRDSKHHMIHLAKPIFDIYRKPTTEELIQQTTSQLDEQNLINSNQYQHQNAKNTDHNHMHLPTNANFHVPDNSTSLLQQLAAKKREEIRVNELYGSRQNTQCIDEKEKFKNNSFWAFQDDDDYDDDDDINGTNNTAAALGSDTASKDYVSPFQFAAPSFAVPTVAPTNHKSTEKSIIDPDL